MVTCVPGHSDCTASASTCAQSCRINSSARGSSRETNSIFASCAMESLRSARSPSSVIATVRLASEGEMLLAISRPVVSFRNSRLAPSGKVSVTFAGGCAGLRLVMLYWNPDSDLCSDMHRSLSSLLRTSAGKREYSDIAADTGVAMRLLEVCRRTMHSTHEIVSCRCIKISATGPAVNTRFACAALMLEKHRHRLLGDGAGGDALRTIGRARRQHPHCGPADHFRRGGVVRRLASDSL